MNRVRTLVVVLAGGAGGRLELLTHERAKPAVSFAGTHRLIDFPLSNCPNAGLPTSGSCSSSTRSRSATTSPTAARGTSTARAAAC